VTEPRPSLPPDPSPTTSPAERYRQRRDEVQAAAAALGQRASRISNLRLVAFLAGIGALVWAEVRPETGPLALTVFAAALVGFLVLIVVHSRITARGRRASELAAVNDEGLARIERAWQRLPPVRDRGPAGHPYAHDLDIFGPASVARLLSTVGTGVGRRRLQRWLLAPADPAVARRRQEAVRELAPLLDFRQRLQVAGRLAGDPDRVALEEFLDWAEGEPWLLRRTALLWTARLLPIATVVLLALQIDGFLDQAWWLVPLTAGAILATVYRKRVTRLLERASMGDASLRGYASLVEQIQGQAFTSAPLQEIHAALSGRCDARRELERLGWMTEMADLRHSGVFYLLIHFTTLWDIHVLWGLERWQQRAGRHVREWAEHVAEIDAASALAAVLPDEPGWSFPDLAEGGHRLEAEALAHPLLAADERVPNDVDVGPPGEFLMVTGSNMSGKSTLLRAIGVNAVLALAGGPVCARRMTVPPLDVRTSMRVEDSLERGVSLFMAELQQLKRVVDAADEASPERLLLYLLDEILHGTNTAERQVAVREVLAHLLRKPAIGAISTHDLELAAAEPLASAVRPVHFRETVHPEGHEPPMTFDYVLRDGIATSTNALKLVRLVGLTGR
jgi:ABC-type multidrug transport system fused ATPase/permease subunit